MKGWVSIEEGARRMGCSIEAAATIAQQGGIRYISDGDKMFLRHEDVEEVARVAGGVDMTPEEMRRRIIFLERKVDKLVESMDLILQINQLSSSRFDPLDDDTLIALFDNICVERNSDQWSQARLLSCCEVFIRIGEEEIERLNALADRKDSWRPFLELCIKQRNYVVTHEDFPVDINFQRCHELLGVGRNNLRAIAIIFIELTRSEGSSYDLLAGLAATDVDAFDALIKKRKRKI